jgi:hypothetical protein
MAAIAAMRGVFTRIGFTFEAASLLVGDQGINELKEIRRLTDSEAEDLCKVLRRPGGAIANTPAAIAAGAAATRSNPGTQVSVVAQNNLKLLCYFLKHHVRVSRDLVPGDITPIGIRGLEDLRLSEEKHKNPTSKPTIDDKDWAKTFESIEEDLKSYLGTTGIPLAYVIRNDEAVPDEDPDGGYSTLQEEMIARAPHRDPEGEFLNTFLTDRTKVWKLLAELFESHLAWTYIKPSQKTLDGRKAFWDAFDHYLGPNNVDSQATKAENVLKNTIYQGEKKRHNFEQYVITHVTQHAILESLEEHGYKGLDDRSKVRHLIDGIKTDALENVQLTIMANAKYRTDFTACVRLYKDFILQKAMKRDASELNISWTETDARKGGIEDRYYDREEYKALSDEQKDNLRQKRIDRGHKTGDKTGKAGKAGRRTAATKRKKAGQSQIDKLTRQVAKLATSVAASKSASKDSDDDSDDAGSRKGNRHNKSLTRQKAKRNDN